ncbi:DHH family phosphoesterase [Lysinibacillus xylanilyticus]|uniref:DHH family phosphoesterase n=1 Tax=Lysinibacillus xylanilyticus TaxID=582475 RepID=UPI0036D983A1
MVLSYLYKALEILKSVIEKGEHITVYGDYDVDGLTCLLQWKKTFELIGYDNYSIVPYTKRTHSIDTNLASVLVENKSGLCIICDTGSAEPKTLKYLNAVAKVIVLDHHRGNIQKSHMTDSLVVVNPALWGDDLQMSAGCVTYELIMAWVEATRPNNYEYFKRMLAFYPFLSIYADGAYGANDYCFNLYQDAQEAMFPPEFSFAEKNFITTKRFVLFSVAPPINAAFRNNRLDLINKLFLSRENLLSYERANLLDELELLRSNMRKHINQLESIVQPTLIGQFALVDLTGYLNQSISNEIIWANKGLIANKIADKYKCACVCIVNTGDEYSLSVRDYFGRDVLNLMQTFYDVGGHPSAFGGTMEVQDVLNLKRVLEKLSVRLRDPKPRKVVNYITLTPSQLDNIALHNEFLHPNDVTLVEVLKSNVALEPTPASWGQRYNQYHIPLEEDKKIYVKQEDFDSPEKPKILIQLFKGRRLMGSMVEVA